MLAKTLAFAALALQLSSAKIVSEGPRSALTRANGKSLKYTKVAGLSSPISTLQTTTNTFALEKVKTIASRLANETVPEIAEDYGEEFAIAVNVNGDDFYLIFDTGSSDTWVPTAGFICLDVDGASIAESECGFGSTYNATIPYNETILDEFFFIIYGDGEYAYGTLSYETVSVGDLTVAKQEMAFVNTTLWEGDGVTSGLMGWAYPPVTQAFNDETYDNVLYNPWIFNIFAQNSTASLFSLALDRDVDEGFSGALGIGGLPSGYDYTGDFIATDIVIAELEDDPVEATNYSFYTIVPDGFIVKSNSGCTPVSTFLAWADYASPGEVTDVNGTITLNSTWPAIVDSGTTLMYLPSLVAGVINTSFDPPAIYVASEGGYEAAADAVPPYVAIVINGQEIEIAAEALLPTYFPADNTTGLSLTGVQASDEIYILGDTFLTNVLAVFDIGASEMKFAARS